MPAGVDSCLHSAGPSSILYFDDDDDREHANGGEDDDDDNYGDDDDGSDENRHLTTQRSRLTLLIIRTIRINLNYGCNLWESSKGGPI